MTHHQSKVLNYLCEQVMCFQQAVSTAEAIPDVTPERLAFVTQRRDEWADRLERHLDRILLPLYANAGIALNHNQLNY